MYAKPITDRDIAALERGYELTRGAPFTPRCCPDISAPDLHRHSLDQVVTATAHFAALHDEKSDTLVRPLTAEERDFIDNEMMLCSVDFLYWAERYGWIELETAKGGKARFRAWGSQKVLLRKLAEIEEAMWAEYDKQVERGYSEDAIRVKGICIILHKARQLGATTLAQLLLMHRAIFSENLFCVVASTDEDKTRKVFSKTERIYNNLPWWMRPSIKSKTITYGYKFGELDVEVALQDGKQEEGLAQGSTPAVAHLTEVAAWLKPEENLQNHFFRAIPWSLRTLVILESTAQGVGNWWHEFTESVRHNVKPTRWHYIFIPWYATEEKYRLLPPDNWTPSKESMQHAKRVFDTSEQFVGYQVTLSRDQLYWYECERQEAIDNGVLNLFLTNLCATPEESFQNTNVSPFNAEVLERHSLTCEKGKPYDFDPNAEFGRLLKRADTTVDPWKEPRGCIWVWEKPNKHYQYVVGVDASRGLPGWSRLLRKENDTKTDNCAIEVWRVGERGEPHVQVAEFAAPITTDEAAPIVNFLGRLYAGRDEDGAEVIVETYPSPGEPLQEKLVSQYGYYRLWRRANINTGNYSRDCGWEATGRSVLYLWSKTTPVLSFKHPKSGRVKAIIRSEWLVDEMKHCETDPAKATAKAEYGFHDDRVRASQLAILAIEGWQNVSSYEDERAESEERRKVVDYQASDMTSAEMVEAIEEKLNPTW